MLKRNIFMGVVVLLFLLSFISAFTESKFDFTPSPSGPGSNITNFTQLYDTPSSYVGAGGNCVIVNVGETGLEFTPCSSDSGITEAEFQSIWNSNATPYIANWYNHTLAVEGLYGKWFYNQTTPAITYLNSTYGKFWYNMTDGNDGISSTLANSTYARLGANNVYSLGFNNTLRGALVAGTSGGDNFPLIKIDQQDDTIGSVARIYFLDYGDEDTTEYIEFNSTSQRFKTSQIFCDSSGKCISELVPSSTLNTTYGRLGLANTWTQANSFRGNIIVGDQVATAYDMTFYNDGGGQSLKIYGNSGNISSTGRICDSVGCISSGSGSSAWQSGAGKIYNDTAGVRVGIGTNEPKAGLEVAGATANITIYNNQFTDGSPFLRFDEVPTGLESRYTTFEVGYDGGQQDAVIRSILGDLNLTAQNNILLSSKVGIGTTSPTADLSIVNPVSAGITLNSSATNPYASLTFANASANAWLIHYATGTTSDLAFYSFSQAKNILYLNNAGNVGIGTDFPLSNNKLQVEAGSTNGVLVNGSSANIRMFLGNAQASGIAGYYFDAADGDGAGSDYAALYQEDDLDVVLTNFGSSNANILLQPDAGVGKLAIGTDTTPDFTVDIKSTAGLVYLNLDKVSGQNGGFIFQEAEANRWLIDMLDSAGDDLRIYSYGNTAQAVGIDYADGSVVIGTGTPTVATGNGDLAVTGNLELDTADTASNDVGVCRDATTGELTVDGGSLDCSGGESPFVYSRLKNGNWYYEAEILAHLNSESMRSTQRFPMKNIDTTQITIRELKPETAKIFSLKIVYTYEENGEIKTSVNTLINKETTMDFEDVLTYNLTPPNNILSADIVVNGYYTTYPNADDYERYVIKRIDKDFNEKMISRNQYLAEREAKSLPQNNNDELPKPAEDTRVQSPLIENMGDNLI